jgi:putative ABC transport system permease protein
MNVYPILAALRRHKAATLIIVLQVALTLAIVANAFFIIGHTIERMQRTSGLDEEGLIFIFQKLPVVTGDDAAVTEKIDALQRADLQAIRNLPDVQDAAASRSFPLLVGDGAAGDISLDADRKGKFVHAAYYYGDEHLRTTFGAHLIAGRDFFASEIRHGHALPDSAVIIVSKPLANLLFPSGNALGQTVYQDGHAATIVGIVERLPTPTLDDSNWPENSIIEPLRKDAYWTGYVARARNGRTPEAVREIHKALFTLNPMRHMPAGAGVHSLSDWRAGTYDDERGIALLMVVICVILLSVTAAGIVGLASFWVSQRHRQIGVRRALGARKIDILRYFQIEILLIAGGGAVVGALGAVGLNEWLMKHYEMMHLPLLYVAIGMITMLALGQAAVLVPARRASNVPPVVATR